MQVRELLETATEQASALIGKRIETVSGIDRDGDDAWVVSVEVLELERVPNTMDILASYEIKLSDDGELLGFNRRRRYHRAAQDDGRG
ncbi:MAG: gas vesicle protein GvpO [Gaiellaceae bacterium]